MAATSILSTDDEMNAMAGENVDVTGWTDANKTAWGIQAEAYLFLISGYDFVTNVGTLNAISKFVLNEYVARYTAMAGIIYNTAGYSTIVEAEDMINIHGWRMEKLERWITENFKTNLIKA